MGSRNNGLQLIDPKNNTRVRLTFENGLIDNQIMAIIEDDLENIWVATLAGVQKIDIKNKELTNFTTNEGLESKDVYDIALNKGELFLGTSKGITILSNLNDGGKKLWNTKTLNSKQGIIGPDIAQNSIAFDKNDRLWAGGSPTRGLVVIDEIKKDTTAYPAILTGINIMDKKRVFKDVNLLQEKRKNLDSI